MGQGNRCLGLALLCAAVLLTSTANAVGAGGCPNRDATASSAPVGAMRGAVVCLINRQRTERGLTPLTESPKLDRSAQHWSHEMVAKSEFSHAHLVARIDAVHYDWRVLGENIATGYPTPRQAVTAWMASPDHCRNILDPTVRNVGTGERPAPVRGWSTGPATWTQDFGLRMGQTAPSHDYGPARHCPYR